MKYISLFSGIGAFEKALERLGINYDLVGFSEIDKYAVKSYCAIHNVPESLNLGDITKIDEKALPKNIDLVTYGFPCQDISLAGKQKGLFNEDGTQTRSGLFFEALRIIEATQPRVAIAENVKNLTNKKFNAQFQIVLESLEQAGYNNYWQVLNAKDYGIPQNRERVFIVSIRKDIDTGLFKFPQGFPLELRLKDMLEEEVDEKFYIKNSQYCVFMSEPQAEEIAQSEEPKLNMLGMLDIKGNEQVRRVYDANGLSPTLNTMQGGNRQPKVAVETEKVIKVCNVNPSGRGMNGTVIDEEGLARTITIEKGEGQKILVREATKKGYAEAYEGDSVNLEQPNSKTRRGRVGHGVAQTLTTSPQQGGVTAVAMRGRYNENGQAEQQIEISDRDYANAITTVQKDSLIAEPNVLTPKRTEYGKAIRKAYETGEIKESRHNMTELQPRTDGIANTLTTVMKDNYVAEPIIQKIYIPQMVEVRKYPVDCKLLCECLRDYKFKSNFSNKNIAEALGVPLTKVEHWFRQDDCFAIPDPDVWMDLKELLGIETDEFDEPIMTFEKKVGSYEKSERHYLAYVISPTITSTSASEKIIEPSFVNGDICKTVRAGGHGSTDRHSWDMVQCNNTLRIRKLTPKECFRLMDFYDSDFEKAAEVNSNTQLYKQAGNSIVVVCVEKIIGALFECGVLTDEKNNM